MASVLVTAAILALVVEPSASIGTDDVAFVIKTDARIHSQFPTVVYEQALGTDDAAANRKESYL